MSSNNINNSIIANGDVSNSNNNNKNSIENNGDIIRQVRKESVIISFIVGFLSSLLATFLFELFF